MANEIIGKKLPDPDLYSPKIVVLFKGALEPEIADTWNDPETGMEFVFVTGGCYRMGDTFGDGGKDEKPVHEVCVDDFYMGKYEVTQVQWEKVMGENLSEKIFRKLFKKSNNYPVEQVSWNDVQKFIKKLNRKTGGNYRLPTEAEWEYAARSGGKREKWSGTSNESALSEFAWYGDNSKSRTHPVGQKKPNGLGLYDMSGNVYGWCSDWYSSYYYYESPRKNPKGPGSGSLRVIRGGGWYFSARGCRSSDRDYYGPSNVYYILGFRLVLPQAIR
ncbi:MAG: formylglycine-generating enzyme family protein [Planctomycetes bacterium]|nr:formylglycine-generating enzyme family protein [Planctomycetota bacterium]